MYVCKYKTCWQTREEFKEIIEEYKQNGKCIAAISFYFTGEWVVFDSTCRISQYGRYIEGRLRNNLMSHWPLYVRGRTINAG